MVVVYRTLPALLKEAELESLEPTLRAGSLDLRSLASKYAEGRPALLAHLKSIGTGTLGVCQKLTNAIAKAERLGMLQPYLDEAVSAAPGSLQPMKGSSGFS